MTGYDDLATKDQVDDLRARVDTMREQIETMKREQQQAADLARPVGEAFSRGAPGNVRLWIILALVIMPHLKGCLG